MTVALPVWDGRVSPVFDTAVVVRVVSVCDGREVGRKDVSLSTPLIAARAAYLASLGVNVLICGAVSVPQALLIRAMGIWLIPWIGGDAEEVLKAYLGGTLDARKFALPGCARQRRRHRGGFGRGHA